jgi:hypothetical protein
MTAALRKGARIYSRYHQHSAILSAVIDDLALLDVCSETGEWASQFVYLPLR